MSSLRAHLVAALAAAVLVACGSSSTTSSMASSTARGTLVENPPPSPAQLDAATLQTDLAATAAGAQLLEVTGPPACGVDFFYLTFWTVGGANETTESSGALMVPTGAAPGCSGPRPILLYAHGTQTDKAFNIANILDPTNTEGALIAAMFAAQGYIVVAPNYAGYDISTLGYHPFLNATQQSDEMMDILAAARTALPNTFASATSDNGQLFITGYSEGGHVAMATLRAMQAAGMTVTAAAPMSGPYALEAFGDAVFFGQVNIGSTVFAPLLTTSYQYEYGNIYTMTSDIYSPMYESGIATLLPSTLPLDTLFNNMSLPPSQLFDIQVPTVADPILQGLLNVPANPLFAAGFGTPPEYLINDSYRLSYAVNAFSDPDGAVLLGTTALAGTQPGSTNPPQTLRQAFYLNDMRYGSWTPAVPTLLCGGGQDPTVFFQINTDTMVAFWNSPFVSELDVNAAPSLPYTLIQEGFQASQAQELAYYESPAGGSLSPAAAAQQVAENYHLDVAPFCALAARLFFSAFGG